MLSSEDFTKIYQAVYSEACLLHKQELKPTPEIMYRYLSNFLIKKYDLSLKDLVSLYSNLDKDKLDEEFIHDLITIMGVISLTLSEYLEKHNASFNLSNITEEKESS